MLVVVAERGAGSRQSTTSTQRFAALVVWQLCASIESGLCHPDEVRPCEKAGLKGRYTIVSGQPADLLSLIIGRESNKDND